MNLYIEIFGVLTGLLYLYYQIKQLPQMWIVGFITALAYAGIFFYNGVYANMFLQIYFVLASVYGMWRWRFRPEAAGEEGVVYRRVSVWLAVGALAVICALTIGGYFLLRSFSDSTVPVGDAFTTSASVVATWMLAHKIVEHWVLWIISDAVSIYVYFSVGLYPTMGLYACYIALAVIGYRAWIRHGRRL
jgi:nicotinamide mononucleotide transporter